MKLELLFLVLAFLGLALSPFITGVFGLGPFSWLIAAILNIVSAKVILSIMGGA